MAWGCPILPRIPGPSIMSRPWPRPIRSVCRMALPGPGRAETQPGTDLCGAAGVGEPRLPRTACLHVPPSALGDSGSPRNAALPCSCSLTPSLPSRAETWLPRGGLGSCCLGLCFMGSSAQPRGGAATGVPSPGDKQPSPCRQHDVLRETPGGQGLLDAGMGQALGQPPWVKSWLGHS